MKSEVGNFVLYDIGALHPFTALYISNHRPYKMSFSEGFVMNVLRTDGLLKRSGSVDRPSGSIADQRSVSSGTHVVTSLTVMTADTEMNETLLSCLEKNSNALMMLQVCANYWCAAERIQSSCQSQQRNLQLHRCYFILGRIILTVMFLVTLSSLVLKLVENYVYSSVILNVTVTLDLLSVMPAQYLNQQRMLQPAHILDASVIDESIRISKYYLYLCVATVVVSSIMYTANLKGQQGGVDNTLLLVVGEFFIALNLAFNMFFLIMDLKVSSLLLDQLFLLHEKKQLTLDKFTMVREDIKRRVNNSKWASDFIIVPSLASVVTILILVFHTDADRAMLSGAWCIALTKELMFICIAFAYVARVNGRADELSDILCANHVLPPVLDATPDTDAMGMGEYLAKYNDILKEVHRLSIYTSSISAPISFTLLFKRVSWENVAVSATGFVVTILIGLIKSLVPN